MPSSITGPGISGGMQDGSEVAAISFGLYVNAAPLKAGLAEAHGQVIIAGNEIGALGRVAGEKHAKGFSDALVHGGHEFTRSTRALHHLIMAGGSFILIHEAFELGTKIGEAIFHGQQDEIVKHETDLVEATRKTIEKARGAAAEEWSKTQQRVGMPAVDVEGIKAAQEEIEKLNKKIAGVDTTGLLGGHQSGLADELSSIRAKREQLEHDDKLLLRQDLQVHGDLLQALTDEDAITHEINEAIAKRAELETRVEDIKKRAVRLAETEKEIVAQQRQEEQRLRAERDVAVEKMSVDISRLVQIMEMGVRQKTPVSPGTTVIRGGR